MATAAPHQRWTLTFTPKNSDLSFLVFGTLYFYLVHHTGFPFSTHFFFAFLDTGAQLLFGVFVLALPIVLVKALYHGGRAGWSTLTQGSVWMVLLQPYYTLDFVFITIRRIIIILGAIYLFLHLKHLILWWHRANYDLALWNFDRAIHFGVQPNIWAMKVFGAWPDVAILLDWMYIKYFNYKLIVCIVFLMEPRGRKLSDQFFFAYQQIWFVGGLSYLALPSDGPAYAVLSNYSIPKENHFHMFTYPVIEDPPREYVETYLEAKIPTAKAYQELLWIDRQSFLRGKEMPGVFYGIAAMPSLHNAAVWMMMIFLFRASVFAGLAGMVYVVSTFVGSVFLQWHYAIDGYIGALIAIVCCWVAIRMPELWPRLRGQHLAD